jgi:transcriptional regulator with XRE-family HTH domain
VFYDKYVILCKKKGVSPSYAAIEAGISKSLVTKWKTNKIETPSADVLQKLSNYFNISISELLDEEQTPTPKSERDDSEIMFALSRGGEQEITKEMFEEVKRFAAYVAELERKKKLP